MLGAHGFDFERLFGGEELRRFSEAAVAAVSSGTTRPLLDALETAPSPERLERAAFAASVQGLTPLLAVLPGTSEFPPALAEFLAHERAASARRASVLAGILANVTGALEAAGVPTVALKGAVLAFRHYPAPELRPMGDLDLLLAEPSRLADATAILETVGWARLLDTPRHRVFSRPDERVARPACEDAENPVRIELHTSFRMPVLGRTYDATRELLAAPERHEICGARIRIVSGNALGRHLLFHAAEDFASRGLRGIQAHDFRLLSRLTGPLRIEFSGADRKAGLAPVAVAARAVESLFPESFAPEFLAGISAGISPRVFASAARLAPLRYTRPGRGQALVLAGLIESPLRKLRFLLRATFSTPGEVKATAAPDATGPALLAAWGALLARRIARGLAQLVRRSE
ncbi:MAG: nucleotidyltransferase family protein [Thermoanaerobaculia bacterium]